MVYNKLKMLIVCFLVLLAIFLSVVIATLSNETIVQNIKISKLILEITDLEQYIIFLQEQIEEKLKKVAVPASLPVSTGWSHSSIVKLISFGCIITTLITTKIIFAYTPYLLIYTAQSWNYNFISYLYPLIWTKINIPPVFKDSMGNLFRLTFDTSLDKFVLEVQLVGTTTAITISEFIQWVLRLS